MKDAAAFPFDESVDRQPFVEVELQLRPEDYYTGAYWAYRHTASQFRRVLNVVTRVSLYIGLAAAIVTIAGLLSNVLLAWKWTFLERSEPFRTVLLILAVGIALSGVFSWFFKRVYRDEAVKELTAYQEPVLVRLNDLGIWTRSSNGGDFYRWGSVKELEELYGGVAFLLRGNVPIFVPRRSFSSEILKAEFLRFAQERCHA